jgi:hypothetical protein
MENQQLGCPSRQCSNIQVGFCQGFLCKEQCNNTGASPILFWPGYSCFLPILWNAISIKGRRFYDTTDTMVNATEEPKRQKLASRNVSNTFTVAGRRVFLHKGTNLKEMSIEWWCWFVRLRNKVIPKILWSYYILFGSSNVRQKEDIVIKHLRI